MFFKVIFRKISISYKKIRLLINKIKKFSFLNMLIYLNFLNTKSSLILKKIILSFLFSIKKKKLNFLDCKIVLFSSEKCKSYKRILYNSKGRFSILNKKRSNILLSVFIDKWVKK